LPKISIDGIRQYTAHLHASLSKNRHYIKMIKPALQRFDSQLTTLSMSTSPPNSVILDIPPEYPIGSGRDPMELGFPPLSLRTSLVDLYFQHCWNISAVVVPQLFKEKLAQHDQVSPHLGHSDWIDFQVLLFMVLARAARTTANREFCSSQNSFLEQGGCFAQVAHTLLAKCEHTPSINLIQALLEMCSYEQNGPKRFRNFMFAGMAVGSMYKLGLHKQPDDPKLSPLEIKERQILFWICNMRDVESSLNLHAPYKVDLSQCSVPMIEIPEDGWEKRGYEWLQSISKLIMIARQFWEVPKNDGQLRKIKLNDVVELERQMTAWLQELPPDLQYRGGESKRSIDCMRLHVNFFFIKLITYQMLAEKFRTDPVLIEDDIMFVYEQCILAAHGICQLYVEGDKKWLFWHNFHYIAILHCVDMHMREVRIAIRRGTDIEDAFCWLTKSTHLLCEALYERPLMDHDEATLIFNEVLQFWGVAATLIDEPTADFTDIKELLDICFPEKSDRKFVVISVEPKQQTGDKSEGSKGKITTAATESNYLHMTRRFMKLLQMEATHVIKMET
jgi:Fungal specific transcription factor domain